MGKTKKKTSKQTSKSLSPEAYIRTKARQLPVYKCYKSINQFEDREMSIIVVRKHPQGTYTLAGYLIDKWCLGVKDSLWFFNIDEKKLNDFLSDVENRLDTFDEIDYVEAHNWVYGAIAFAQEAGIEPCEDFSLTQYILDEDDENVELVEYNFGRNGKYCLVAKDIQEAKRYAPTLEGTLGKGNYSIEVGVFGNKYEIDDEWDDEIEDYWDKEEEIDEDIEFSPVMNYTYQGSEYPKEVQLNYPELTKILSKDPAGFLDKDIEWVQSLPEDKLRADLQSLILYEIGSQWDKSAPELDKEVPHHWNIVSNSFLFLKEVATIEETFPVVLEVMRQSFDFYEYNFGWKPKTFLFPILYVLLKDNPCLIKPFLMEKGLCQEFKIITFEVLECIAMNHFNVQQEIIEMTLELLNEYKADLEERTICDGTVTAYALEILISLGKSEYLPLIEEFHATNLVDNLYRDGIKEIRKQIQHPRRVIPIFKMNPYKLRKIYQHTDVR